MRHIQPQHPKYDVAFSAFWDWSCHWDAQRGKIEDRYFGDLPQRGIEAGIRPCWFAWLDPHWEGAPRDRSLGGLTRKLIAARDVVPLQSFLSTRDIIKTYFDFSGLRQLRRARNLRKDLQDHGYDFFPLFEGPLRAGFAGATIPTCALICSAYECASLRYDPKLVVSFLEHFPNARALYNGVRRSGRESWLVQHASYCHEKTFLFVDPDVEFGGRPGGCSPPHPDRILTMGALAKRLFAECGYERDRICATGSPRYDHVRLNGNQPKR